MDEIVLFEIPVYSMSEELFDSRWKRKRDRLLCELIEHGHSATSAEQVVCHCFYPKWLWKYNQIVGFIKISVTCTDVLFDLFCSTDKRFFADSKTKHFIEDWAINGVHFYAVDKSNVEIKHEIHKWLKFIEKEHLGKRFYVDYSAFENVIDHVNIKEIIEDALNGLT